MHILIIGFGSIGQRHLRVMRNLLPDAKITIVRQYGSIDPTQPPVGADAITNDLSAVLDQKPDIAIIAGPANDRMSTSRVLVEAKIHVLAEKPISTSTDHVKEVLEIATRNNTIFMVGYVLRHHPVLKALERVMNSNKIGEIFSLDACVGQHLADWRPGTDYRKSVSAQSELGGGAIFELSHELDYVRWLLGQPSAVTCRTSQIGNLKIDVETCANIILNFPSHIQASIHLDFLQRPALRIFSIHGSKGRLDANLIAGTLSFVDGETGKIDKIKVVSLDDRDSLFNIQAQHFLDCIYHHNVPQVSGQDGLEVLEIALAAKRSATSGMTITLPILEN